MSHGHESTKYDSAKMNWRLIKAFPKYTIVVGVLIGSTALFVFWWKFLKHEPRHEGGRSTELAKPSAPVSAQETARAEEITTALGHLILVDQDLIDIESGKVIAKNWLGNDKPLKVWVDTINKKTIARFERGFKRYNFDGSEDATLGRSNGVIISDDMDLAIFSQAGDVWQAGINWQQFKFTNEARATSIGGFQDTYFVQNLVLASKVALVVRNMNQLVRVNLGSGEVVPMPLPINDAADRRSPDGSIFIGDQSGANGSTVYAFDVTTGKVTPKELGTRTAVTGVLWLDKERCLVLVNAQFIVVYNREKGSFSEFAKLPTEVAKLTLPSPSKRYIVVLAHGSAGFFDMETKAVIPLTTPLQSLDWMTGDSIIAANNTMDSNQRGTWAMKLGEAAKRVSIEPYSMDPNGVGPVLRLESLGLVIFGTQSGLFKLKVGGAEAVKIAPFQAPVMRLQSVEEWVPISP